MKVIGLTGGIGMGKSTAAGFFRRAHIPVFDADAEVHRLQARGGAAVPAIAAAFPDAVWDGRVDRPTLRAALVADPRGWKVLEAILHPRVRAARSRFLARWRGRGAPLVVLDIPLLLETEARPAVDLVLVVSAPAAIQRARLRRRRRYTQAEIEAILARQMPDAAKRRRADHVIETGLSRRHADAALRRLLATLRAG